MYLTIQILEQTGDHRNGGEGIAIGMADSQHHFFLNSIDDAFGFHLQKGAVWRPGEIRQAPIDQSAHRAASFVGEQFQAHHDHRR